MNHSASPGTGQPRRLRPEHRRFALVTLLPGLSLLILLSLIASVGAINLAFQDRMLRFPDAAYVGLENFERLFRDRRFANALQVSAIWEVVTVVCTMLLAVLLAILLVEGVRSPRVRNAICILLIIPVLLPRVSAGLIWRFLYSPTMGAANYPLTMLGLPPIEFLSDPQIALYAVALVDIWQWGLFFGVVLAKLIETLPKEPQEAARLDHAGTLGVYWWVALPMLRGPIIMMTFVKAIESLRSFDLIYTMTAGGPGISTETLDLYAFQQGIGISGRISYASSLSVLLMVMTVIIFSILWKRAARWAA
ncbi:carbohydrate ABC transporter permease [Geminicoccus harenae]|uniref:carbohydrate ABC transporter permease n=1 Tax=Geminicoccus harenae TaxID=2498453 RepID=UPI00168B0E24|nr:sugar ABC transporter permease [Geminicoccus harenae]